jgi:hypothetical protein
MFVREAIAKPLMGILAGFTLGIAYFWLVWDSRNQELWDKVVGTVIVNDPQKQLLRTRIVATEQHNIRPRSGLDALPFPPADPERSEPEPAAAPMAPREAILPSAADDRADT